MSKLDNILGGKQFSPGLGSRQTNDLGLDRTQFKETKQDVKELFLELFTDNAYPDQYGDLVIEESVFRQKVEEL